MHDSFFLIHTCGGTEEECMKINKKRQGKIMKGNTSAAGSENGMIDGV
jgi:hypothetical protein